MAALVRFVVLSLGVVLAAATEKSTTKDDHADVRKDIREKMNVSLVDARRAVREKVLRLKANGTTLEDIEDMGYTRNNLGCQGGKRKKDVLERCLTHLQTGFTPLELEELLGLKTDHDAKMLQNQGLQVQTKGWKVGEKVVMCWRKGEGSGCVFRTVSKVADDKVSMRHVVVDASTGQGKLNGHDFTVYSLSDWKTSPKDRRALLSKASLKDDHADARKDIKEKMGASLLDSRKAVREKVLELKANGTTLKQIEDMGYTRNNLGCKGGKREKDALERCLTHLQKGFTPLELEELLGLKTDHDAKMLQNQGLQVQTEGWKVGEKVVMCWRKGEGSGCLFRKVSKVTEDEISMRHVVVDASTGQGKVNGHDFTVYSLRDWK